MAGGCYCCGLEEGVKVMWEWRSDLAWDQEECHEERGLGCPCPSNCLCAFVFSLSWTGLMLNGDCEREREGENVARGVAE